MFGFSISTKGILTDNYYKKLGYYEKPEPQGAYVMIRKYKDKIILNQDFHGSFGLYTYENKEKNYFAISNSFLLLGEYLVGKQNFSFNKEFADNLIISRLYTYSLNETMIKEIAQLPRNTFIIINIKNKSFQIHDIDYKENTIPIETPDGLKIIDKWVDKWGFIFRSLKKQTDIISCDLSGGFDTRIVLSVLINSGINLNEILIHSVNDTKHVHMEDFKIASNISSKLGFKLNRLRIGNKGKIWSIKDSISCTMYSKLGFHKEFYFKKIFFDNPRFSFNGNGGEDLRGSPGCPIKNYVEKVSTTDMPIYSKEFYNSSKNLINRSIDYLKQKKNYSNDFDISYDLYSRIVDKNHFGRSAVEAFISNVYLIQPLMDPEIKKIKFEIHNSSPHDLIAFIYTRFANDLISFPFQGKRILNVDSIRKANKLNSKLLPYKIKSDYNKDFFIDFERKSPVKQSKENKNINKFLSNLFESEGFLNLILKTYDIKLYNWSKDYINKTNYHPLKHHFALLAVAVTTELISVNEKILFKKMRKNLKKN